MKSAVIVLIAVAVCCLLAPKSFAQSSASPNDTGDKASLTPDFYQKDAQAGFSDGGDMYCGPVAVSDAFIYLASQGYHGLVPSDTQSQFQSQVEMIKTLAASRYMNTASADATNATSFLEGIRGYVKDHGYTCQELQYAGSANLGHSVAACKVAGRPTLSWIDSGVAQPDGFVWLLLGKYVRDDSGQWTRMGGHYVAVVGYGPNGALIIHNPNRESFDPPAQTLADDAVTLTPITSGVLIFPNRQVDANGAYIASGPGLPHSPDIDDFIVDGAFLLVLGNPPSTSP